MTKFDETHKECVSGAEALSAYAKQQNNDDDNNNSNNIQRRSKDDNKKDKYVENEYLVQDLVMMPETT